MKTLPKGAGFLLDLIQSVEAPKGYDTIYGNKPTPKPLTQMTIKQVLAAQRGWTKTNGSSAAGGMQIMRATLLELVGVLGLTGSELFDRNMQRSMGYHLLLRRGYQQFVDGKIDVVAFARMLAQEWASFPVLAATKGAHRQLKRGQSYYTGDPLNKALITPVKVEAALTQVLGKGKVAAAVETAKNGTSTTTKVVAGCGATAGVGGAIVAGTQDAQTTLEQIEPITNTVSMLGQYGAYIAGGVVALLVVLAVTAALYKWAKS